MELSDRIGRRMKLNDLNVLMTVVQAGSMNRAAVVLNTTQPAISRSIAELEQTRKGLVAQAELLTKKREMLRILAPIDGQIIHPFHVDETLLSRPVKIGSELFTIAAVGMADDRLVLRGRHKLGGQILAAGISSSASTSSTPSSSTSRSTRRSRSRTRRWTRSTSRMSSGSSRAKPSTRATS